jgi:hypothetical protein
MRGTAGADSLHSGLPERYPRAWTCGVRPTCVPDATTDPFEAPGTLKPVCPGGAHGLSHAAVLLPAAS